MQQVLIGIILVLGLGSFYLYNQNQVLSANNLALEGAVAEQQAAMEVMKESYERQGKALNNLASKNALVSSFSVLTPYFLKVAKTYEELLNVLPMAYCWL